MKNIYYKLIIHFDCSNRRITVVTKLDNGWPVYLFVDIYLPIVQSDFLLLYHTTQAVRKKKYIFYYNYNYIHMIFFK